MQISVVLLGCSDEAALFLPLKLKGCPVVLEEEVSGSVVVLIRKWLLDLLKPFEPADHGLEDGIDVVSAECGGFYANELFRQFELVYLLKVVALAQFHHI